MKNNERIISISNKGKNYFIHFLGTTHYDEDKNGKKVERENFEYLDESFNRFILNGSFDTVREFRINALKKGNTRLFVGVHSPEIETADGEYIPYNNSKVYGLWEKPSKEDLSKYQRILIEQNEERNKIRLYL